MNKVFVVAIDGHSGCGKSSLCSEASKKMGWVIVSTGSLYRGLGYLLKKKNVDPQDEKAFSKLLKDFCNNVSWKTEASSLYYKEEDLSKQLYGEDVGALASSLASRKDVRSALLPVQRNLIHSYHGKIVLVEGRDITSVICPDAPLKIFMTASIEDRAKRRFSQLQEKKSESLKSLVQLKEEISQRDYNDSSREIAPLIQTKDSIKFDTSELSFQESLERFIQLVKSCFLEKSSKK